jgi:hypothetical protein
MGFLFKNVYKSLKEIYTPMFLLLNLVIAIVYLVVYDYIVGLQGPASLNFVPGYMIYLLVITSSMLITISISSVRKKVIRDASLVGDAVGTITTIVGGIISGCNCSAPLLFELVALGVGSSEIVALNNFISAAQIWIFFSMILLNVVILLYVLNKFSDPSCRIKPRTRRQLSDYSF